MHLYHARPLSGVDSPKARAYLELLLPLQCSWLRVRALCSEHEAPSQDATGRALQLQLPKRLRDDSQERDDTNACREVSDEWMLRGPDG